MTKQRTPYLLAASAAVVALIVYLPALRNGFVDWDDNLYIYDNYHIRSLKWSFFQWAFRDISSANWHPLTWLSHAFDYALWGLNPAGHHFTSILVHAANTFLVVLLSLRLLGSAGRLGPETQPVTASAFKPRHIMITAGVTGLLFGIHPLHVESVAWASERKDLLCAFFYLLSTLSYLRFVGEAGQGMITQQSRSPFRNKQYRLSVVFFLLALMSKPMSISLPLVLLILDWYPLDRISSMKSLWNACVQKTIYFAGSLFVSSLAFFTQRTTGAMESMGQLTMANRISVAANSLLAYLGKMILPLDLSPYYPYPRAVSWVALGHILPVLLVVGITAVSLAMAARRKLLPAVWGYYLITLLPVLGLVQIGGQAMADRYTYLPSLGPNFLLGLAAGWVWVKADSLRKCGSTVKRVLAGAMIVLAAVLSCATVNQILFWKDSIVLWSHVIEKEPQRVPLAFVNRGMAFRERGLLGRAVDDYTAALSLDPRNEIAYIGRGLVFRELGRYDRAQDDNAAAIALDPRSATAYANRGMVFGETGQFDRALSDFNTAISLDGEYADAYVGRGLVFKETGRLDRALADLNRAISINPFNATAYLNRGTTFEQAGQIDRALSDYDRAITLNPYDYLAYRNRGAAFNKTGQVAKSIEDYEKAISLKPDFVQAYLDRGGLYLTLGQGAFAAADFRRACDLGSKSGCRLLRSISGTKEPE